MLLDIRGLTVELETPEGVIRPLEEISFSMEQGEAVGLVGESGVGKTLTALAILRLLPSPPARIAAGQLLFNGQDLRRLPEREMRGIRGAQIAMIFQELMTALNPVLKVGEQIAEVLRLHQGLSRGRAREQAIALLTRVQIPAAAERARAYPHQLSGGMRQRVLLAMALAGEPQLLIADEPTTALDVTVQAQMLELLQDARERSKMGLLMITHDLEVLAGTCSRVIVLYAGQVVEVAPTTELIRRPAHPYTAGLIEATRSLAERAGPLTEIPGALPDPREMPSGCRFAPRCFAADQACRAAPPALTPSDSSGRQVRCIHPLTEEHGLP